MPSNTLLNKQFKLFELYDKRTELNREIDKLRLEIDKLSFLENYPTLNPEESCAEEEVPVE